MTTSLRTALAAAGAARPVRNLGTGTRIVLLRIAALSAFIAVWEFVVRIGAVDVLFISTPTGIIRRILDWTTSGLLFDNLAITMIEAGIGWIIASVLGISAGYLAASSKTLDAVLSPFVDAFNAAPRLALVPLLVIWFGLGIASKIALVVTVATVLAFIATNAAVKGVDRDLVLLSRTLGASRAEIALKVVWPWSLPFIFSGLRAAMSLSLTAAVIGEMLVAQSGLGVLIAKQSGVFDTTGVLAGITVVMIIAYFISLVLADAERRLLVWRPDALASR